MAHATISSATTTTFATSVGTMAVNVGSPAAGTLLIAHVGVRNQGTWTVPSGWNTLVEQAGGGTVGEAGVWWKVATGSEGATQTWTAGTATTASWQVRQITNWHGSQAPEYVSNNGDAVAINLSSVTASWGSDDNTVFALVGSSANTMNFTGAPSGYTSLASTTASSGGGASNAGSSYKQVSAASDDPGAYTVSQNRWWAGITVIVRGAGGATGQIKVWNGSSWVAKPVKVWNGTSWVVKPLKRYNGSTFVVTPY